MSAQSNSVEVRESRRWLRGKPFDGQRDIRRGPCAWNRNSAGHVSATSIRPPGPSGTLTHHHRHHHHHHHPLRQTAHHPYRRRSTSTPLSPVPHLTLSPDFAACAESRKSSRHTQPRSTRERRLKRPSHLTLRRCLSSTPASCARSLLPRVYEPRRADLMSSGHAAKRQRLTGSFSPARSPPYHHDAKPRDQTKPIVHPNTPTSPPYPSMNSHSHESFPRNATVPLSEMTPPSSVHMSQHASQSAGSASHAQHLSTPTSIAGAAPSSNLDSEGDAVMTDDADDGAAKAGEHRHTNHDRQGGAMFGAGDAAGDRLFKLCQSCKALLLNCLIALCVTDTDCWISSPKVTAASFAEPVRALRAERFSKICG